MAQILDPLPNDDNSHILCCYVNATSQIQIARITNIPNWYFERVVFPGQRLVFEAQDEAILEIHTGMMASAILSDTIPCDRLALQPIEKKAVPRSSLETDSLDVSTKSENTENGSTNTSVPSSPLDVVV